MTKKTIISFLSVLLLVAFAAPVFAKGGVKNGTYLEWTWQGNKSAYFMTTGSGIVHAWSYDHPTYDDAKFLFKPLSKFENATEEGCDDGYLNENLSWNPDNLYNVMDTDYADSFWDVFDENEDRYMLCIYPM